MFVTKRAYRMRGGFSLVEVIVVAALTTLLFGGLFAGLQFMISLIGTSKAEAGARSLAVERLEYIRSLPYESIGTIGGIPNGNIPQNSSSTLNNITYNERILIEYVDDPDDGTGASDSNSIVADYKRVKVEYSWSDKGTDKFLSLITNVVPEGIETTEGGGTLTVNVFDAGVNVVPGASVRVFNDTGTSTIDVTRYTNDSGVAQFSGADALSNYQITVTKDGYSTDGTYTATASNPNPNPAPVSVIESQVSTMSFQIDMLSDLAISTVGIPTSDTVSDTFTDSTGLSVLSNTTVSGGAVVLTGSAGSYVSSGTVRGNAITPSSFDRWDTASFSVSTTSDTSVVVQVYQVTGTSTALVPDSLVAGNSTGFIGGSVIDLSGLDAVTYPSLALGATLTTSNASSTPELTDWEVSYVVDEPPIANVPFTMTGSKTIGTTASSAPVYKYEESLQTGSGGTLSLIDLEWDVYDISLDTSSYDIAEACDPIPYALDPGVSSSLKLTLASAVSNSLRVLVEDTTGNPITSANVTVSRTGFTDSGTTSTCGQIFFNSGLVNASDYQVDVSATGYTNENITDVGVDGASTLTVTLSI